MKHASPGDPRSSARGTASRTRCSSPTTEADGGRRDPARRRLGEGEPLRLRARLPRRGHGRARLRRARPRPLGEAPSDPRRNRGRDRDGRPAPCPGARSGGAARLEHGRLRRRSAAARAGADPPLRRRGDLPGARGAPAAGASGPASSCASAATSRATEAMLEPDGHLRGRPPCSGPDDRAVAAARARRRVDPVHRQRGAPRAARRTRSGCSCCREGTIARSSTTSSCRPSRARFIRAAARG